MLDEADRKLLATIRTGAFAAPPSLKDPKWAYLLLGGGLAFVVADFLVTGALSGVAGGFLMGCGLMALVLAGPVSRVVWRCQRLVRAADAKGAIGPPPPPD
ncbi:MAG: hypothetical protein ACT4PV_03890 [Planctomycetaceae bacterium]